MAYLAYVRSLSIWAPPAIEPQIVHEEKMVDYIISQRHLVVVERYQLTEAEAKLSLADLVRKYPCKTKE